MFYYFGTFVLILYLPVATLAIECLQCYQKWDLSSSEVLNTTRSDCEKKTELGDTCMASLSIDFENKTATANFYHVPDQVLTLSNGNKIIIQSITMWFNKNITSQLFQLLSLDNVANVEDLNKTYNKMKNLKYEELRTKLREHLYTPVSYVPNLTCSNSQGQTVDCPNGFCQLTRAGISNVDRRCVPQGKGANPSGIIITSSTIDRPDAETAFSYACNKAMCNGADTDAKVRQLLIDYELLDIKNAPPPNSAMTILHQTMMHFHWMLLLTITNLLKM